MLASGVNALAFGHGFVSGHVQGGWRLVKNSIRLPLATIKDGEQVVEIV